VTSSPQAALALPATGQAPAKLILSGEHAVVYGHPAVAVAVDRWTRVHLDHQDGPSSVHSTAGQLPDIIQDALHTVIPREGLRVSIDADIPLGRGMGSSASLAVATVRAWSRATGQPLDAVTLNRSAHTIETVFHGTPSGVDHGVIGRGGAIRFQRTRDGISIHPMACPALPLVVFDSGTAGSTRDLVAGVRARRDELAPVLTAIGTLTERVIAALEARAPLTTLGPLLTENHRLLRALGVSTKALDHLVDFALQHGAHGAKLAGAGGGGVVLALAPEPEHLVHRAQQAGLTAFAVDVVPPTGSPA